MFIWVTCPQVLCQCLERDARIHTVFHELHQYSTKSTSSGLKCAWRKDLLRTGDKDDDKAWCQEESWYKAS